MKGPESVIQKAILEYLSYRPGFYYRQNTGAITLGDGNSRRFVRFGTRGAADITGIKEGRRIEIEVKAPGRKQTKDQKEYQKKIEANGGLYVLAYSVDDVMAAGL